MAQKFICNVSFFVTYICSENKMNFIQNNMMCCMQLGNEGALHIL